MPGVNAATLMRPAPVAGVAHVRLTRVDWTAPSVGCMFGHSLGRPGRREYEVESNFEPPGPHVFPGPNPRPETTPLTPNHRRTRPVGILVGALCVLGFAGWRQAGDGEPQADDPRVWVAIDFVDQENGLASEVMGRVSPVDLDALLHGRRSGGFLSVDDVFWLYEDGSVEIQDDDPAHGATSHYRADLIQRVTPLKPGFAEEARKLKPEDRIVPAPGRAT